MDEPERRRSKSTLYIPPGSAAAGRVDYSLKEQAMRGTKVLETAKVARRKLELSTPDLLGSKGPIWNASNIMDLSKASKFTTLYSGLALSNSLSPAALNEKDMRTARVSNARFSSQHPSTTIFNRDLPSWSDWQKGWNGSTSPLGERQMRRTLEEQLDKSQRHSLKVTSRSFGGHDSGYISPVRRQEMIIEAAREKKMAPPEERLDRDLVERYGVEGAEHMMFIQELSGKYHEREEQMLTMLKESGGKLPSSPGGRRVMRASKEDLTSVISLPPVGTAAEVAQVEMEGAEDKEAEWRRAGGTVSTGGLPFPPWRKV